MADDASVQRRAIGWTGRLMLGGGALLIAAALFQLWGTGVAADRAQDDLAERLAVTNSNPDRSSVPTAPERDPAASLDPTVLPSAVPPSTVAPPIAESEVPGPGEPLGVLRLPTINVEQILVQGVSQEELRTGPGHYPGTPLPGQAGNASIAGHRTTYGAPFGDIDQLQPGDAIEVETFQGSFTYRVLAQTSADGKTTGHQIVDPTDTYVVEDYGDNRLTLTACHPKNSARERIVVHAELVADDTRWVAPTGPTAATTAVTLPGELFE